jgi:hypothetical protein
MSVFASIANAIEKSAGMLEVSVAFRRDASGASKRLFPPRSV